MATINSPAPLEPYQRTPGTNDPGADFARQVKPGIPPVGQILKKVSIPSDGTYHYVPHTLNRAYVCAQVAGYSTYRAGVFMLSPSETLARGKNPANVIGVFGLSGSGQDNIIDLWCF